jgi:hypothetical protein
MGTVIGQSGVTTMAIDFTQAMWPLAAGLLGLLVVSAGGIVYAAVHHHFSQQTKSISETANISYQQAA